MTLEEQLKALKIRIKALATKDALNEIEAGDLQKMMSDAKALDMRIAAAEYAGNTEPDATHDPVDMKITKALAPVIKALESIPGLDAAKYLTHMGGTADPTHKSLGDFLLAIKRSDIKRLKTIYNSIKTLEEDGGASGGYLVPEEFHRDLLQASAMASQVVPLVTRVPVATDAGSYPALDQFTAPTAGVGQTAFAAGLTLAETAESGTIQTDEPSFTEIEYRIHKIGDLVYVSNELNSDSPQSLEAILRALFAIAIAAKEEFYVFRGTGVGSPLGILNSSAVVNVTPATASLFSHTDATVMISRLHTMLSGGRWFMHPSVFPDVASWEIGTAGAGAAENGEL